MIKRQWLIGGAALALVGIAVLVRGFWTTDGVAARQNEARPVPVETAVAGRKTMPVRLTALGNVTPVASVAIKTQVDTTITEVHFRDGASVQKGDLLFTLDCRQIEADMKRVQAIIDGAQSTLEQAQRDVERYTDLVGRNATPIVTLNGATTTSTGVSTVNPMLTALAANGGPTLTAALKMTESRQLSSTHMTNMLNFSPCWKVLLKFFSLTRPAMVWLAMKAPEARAPSVVKSTSAASPWLVMRNPPLSISSAAVAEVWARNSRSESSRTRISSSISWGRVGMVHAYWGTDWLMNFCRSMRVIMFRLSKTPSHLCAVAEKAGTCTSRLFKR